MPLATATTRVGGLRIHWLRARAPSDPTATPVVAVHGLGVSTRHLMPTLVRVARERPVYAPGLPGFGSSARPPRPLAVPELARIVAEWLTAIGVERAHFVGNSMGCQVIAELAASRPDRVGALVLVGPTVDPGARSLAR